MAAVYHYTTTKIKTAYMKKIIVAVAAVAISFTSIAQDQQGKKWDKKDRTEQRGGHSKIAEKLNLTDAQKTQAKTLNESFRKQMQELKANTSITDDQRKERREALAKEHRSQFEAILTPEQKAKAQDLKKDFKGDKKEGRGERKEGKKDFGKGGEKNFEKMQQELGLTADQTSRMKSVNDKFKTDIQSIHSNSSLTQDQKKEQMQSLQKKHREEIQSLLTDEQKSKMKDHRKDHDRKQAK
jgi:Spy/CpxP family protein refolding chaperone